MWCCGVLSRFICGPAIGRANTPGRDSLGAERTYARRGACYWQSQYTGAVTFLGGVASNFGVSVGTRGIGKTKKDVPEHVFKPEMIAEIVTAFPASASALQHLLPWRHQ